MTCLFQFGLELATRMLFVVHATAAGTCMFLTHSDCSCQAWFATIQPQSEQIPILVQPWDTSQMLFTNSCFGNASYIRGHVPLEP